MLARQPAERVSLSLRNQLVVPRGGVCEHLAQLAALEIATKTAEHIDITRQVVNKHIRGRQQRQVNSVPGPAHQVPHGEGQAQ
jgi:hypothetical protein